MLGLRQNQARSVEALCVQFPQAGAGSSFSFAPPPLIFGIPPCLSRRLVVTGDHDHLGAQLFCPDQKHQPNICGETSQTDSLSLQTACNPQSTFRPSKMPGRRSRLGVDSPIHTSQMRHTKSPFGRFRQQNPEAKQELNDLKTRANQRSEHEQLCRQIWAPDADTGDSAGLASGQEAASPRTRATIVRMLKVSQPSLSLTHQG